MPRTAPEMLLAANPADSERWSTLVSASPMDDVYYSPAYARATSILEHSEPVAIVAGPDSCKFLAPLLLRRMSAVVNGSKIDWTDASSPYGYGGLLNLSGSESPDPRDLVCFLDDLHDWCTASDVVCCVLRLHPLMRQEEWFLPGEPWPELVRIRSRGPTTAIDIENWDNARDQPFGMRKGRRYDLNSARRTLRVTCTSGHDADAESSLDLFYAIYERTMERHRADDFLRFPRSYFSRLASLGPSLGIAFTWLNDQLTGASVFLAGHEFAHYHLSAVNDIGMKFGAATLLIVEGSKWARQQGCKLLHLGGGMKPADSLADFKCSFGGHSYRYAYVIYVADPGRFEQLCRLPNAPWPYRMNEE